MRRFAPAVVVLAAVLVLWASAFAAERTNSAFGVMAGMVSDGHGTPQMGAAVALIATDGRVLQLVYSNDRGAFLMERLLPGLYSLRISLASFLPVLKENILIQPGIRSFLSINLASLFDAVDVLRGRRPAALGDDDWIWVVRSSGATRPALRYQPVPDNTSNAGRQRGVRDSDARQAVLQFSGGPGRSSSVGSEADFNTSFTIANSVLRNTSLLFSGNVGYERQTPATAFRGVLRREMSNGSNPEVSVTLRQIFLPSALFGVGGAREDHMQSLTLAAGDRFQVAGSLRLEYGFVYDSVSFLDRLNSFRPYGRIVYDPGKASSLQLSYTEGMPRQRFPGEDPLREVASELALFPRVSMRNGSAAVQHGRHMEAGYQRKLGDSTLAQAAVYRDDISDLALNAGFDGDALLSDFLPDVFTQQHSFNSGDHHTSGVRAALEHKFSDRLQATVAYNFGGALMPERTLLLTNNPEELRGILKMQRTYALSAKLAANIPVTHTRVFAAYKWVRGPVVCSTDIYDDSFAQAEPHLNLLIRQPLPSLLVLPGRIEALADFRNLLAQGYVPLITADGRRLLMVQSVRSLRGGLSFVF